MSSFNFSSRTAGILLLIIGGGVNLYLVEYIFSPEGHIETVFVRRFFMVLSVGLMLMAVLMVRRVITTGRLLNNLVFAAFVSLVFFYLLVGLDRAVGKWLYPGGLLYDPSYEVKYETPEFTFTARINHLGIRDQAYNIDKGRAYRVAVIGDSFTYGWGVDNQDVWSQVVEDQYAREGKKVELLNLGSSGASPRKYLEHARKAVPLLKPDLLILAILQGDDLKQTINEVHAVADRPVQLFSGKPLVVYLFPNFARWRNSGRQLDVLETWQFSAQHAMDVLTPQEKARFERLSADTRRMFFAGEVNPLFVLNALRDPNYFMVPQDTLSVVTQKGILAMAHGIQEIRDICYSHGTRLLLLSVPAKPYTCYACLPDLQQQGYQVDSSLVQDQVADAMLARIGRKLLVPVFSCTPAFVASADTVKLFYTHDSHFTRAGNHLLAGQLKPYLDKHYVCP